MTMRRETFKNIPFLLKLNKQLLPSDCAEQRHVNNCTLSANKQKIKLIKLNSQYYIIIIIIITVAFAGYVFILTWVLPKTKNTFNVEQ